MPNNASVNATCRQQQQLHVVSSTGGTTIKAHTTVIHVSTVGVNSVCLGAAEGELVWGPGGHHLAIVGLALGGEDNLWSQVSRGSHP